MAALSYLAPAATMSALLLLLLLTTPQALPHGLLSLLESIQAAEAQRGEGRRKKAALSTAIEHHFSNQDRLRENLKSLEKVAGSATCDLTKRYLRDLDKQEDELLQARRSIQALEEADCKLSDDLKQRREEVQATLATMRE